VHYSGNDLNPRSLQVVKRILGVIDGNGYLTGGGRDGAELDGMFADLSQQMDVKKINQMIKEKKGARTNLQDQKVMDAFASPTFSKQRPGGGRSSSILKGARRTARSNKLRTSKNQSQNLRTHKDNVRKTGLHHDYPVDKDYDNASKKLLSLDTCNQETNIM